MNGITRKVNSVISNNKVEVNVEDCTNCNMCVQVCPYSLYIPGEKSIQLSELFNETCIECGHCVAICPVNIISLKCHQDEKFKLLPKKDTIASFESLYNLAISRRSIRHFKKQEIPKELLEKIFELARYTATGHNEENIFYTIIQDPVTLKEFTNEITKNIKNFVEKFEDPEGYESLKRVMPENTFKRAAESVKSFKRKIDDIATGKEVWHWDAPLLLIHSPKSAATLVGPEFYQSISNGRKDCETPPKSCSWVCFGDRISKSKISADSRPKTR